MNKNEFLAELRERLSGLPKEDIEKSVEYYSEMIDERIEDGLSEEDAVSAVGSVDEAVSQMTEAVPLAKLVKERLKPKRELRAWEIVLIVLGFPLWFPLILSAVIVVLAIYIVIWSVVVSVYAVAVSSAACAIALPLAGILLFTTGGVPQGLFSLGAGLIFAGLAIMMFLASNQVAKGILWLSGKFISWIKHCFTRKEETQ